MTDREAAELRSLVGELAGRMIGVEAAVGLALFKSGMTAPDFRAMTDGGIGQISPGPGSGLIVETRKAFLNIAAVIADAETRSRHAR